MGLEGSMPWNDQGGGDGNPGANHFDSPYSAIEWHGLWNSIIGGNPGVALVVGGIGSNLAPVQRGAGANMSVDIGSGEALVNGARYKVDATKNVAIATADATNPRIDRIVLQYTPSTVQTVRLAVVQGTPAATPSLPTLTQTSALYEVEIAQVYVRAAVTTITTADISDKRVFAPNFLQNLTDHQQLIHNSEFMAFSRLSVTPTGAPDAWDTVGTATFASATKSSVMSRGRAVQITAGAANSGMSQTQPCRASTTYTVKTLIKVNAGDVGAIKVTTNSASPGTITREIRRTGAFLEERIYYTTEADATMITVSLLGVNNTDIVTFGQVLLVEGFIAGNFRQIHESIQCRKGIIDSNWDATAKSSGTTTIDLDTDFGGLILPGTRSVRMMIHVNDSGTPTNPGVVIIHTVGGTSSLAFVDAVGRTSNAAEAQEGIAPLDANLQFDVQVIASGVLTSDVTLRILGMEV